MGGAEITVRAISEVYRHLCKGEVESIHLGELVIGDGLIGKQLFYYLRRLALDRDDVYITSRKGNGIYLDLANTNWDLPDCKIAYICAGITSTAYCEEHRQESYLINVTNTQKLAEYLTGKDALVVYISSERVFDGNKPFREVTEPVCPITEYGRQKAEIERVLLDMGVTVIRFSKVIGWSVPLFESWIDGLRAGKFISAYSNMGMSALPVSFAVETLYKLSSMKGLYQISGLYDIPYYRIAYYLCNYLQKDISLVKVIEAVNPHSNTTLVSNIGQDIPDVWETIIRWCEHGTNCAVSLR